MAFHKIILFQMLVLFWMTSVPLSAGAGVTTLGQSIEKALDHSPRLQALRHNHGAVEYDLRQSRARCLPSVDLQLGYGLEQHSDGVTRQTGAEPADTDWDPRGNATLRLTQKVYDGGETGQQVSIQESLLESSDFTIQDAAQAIALNAVRAHLEVYRQRKLVALAEKNLKIHEDIFQSLYEMEKAGAGNIADVTQTRARMARARSNLLIGKAELTRAMVYYTRVIGAQPGELAPAEVPKGMPASLKEALGRTEQNNPELLAFNARLTEADARVALARSNYKPKINIELSSSYNDNLEGDPSWQNTNEAMLTLHWNLFNGGQDKAKKNAALSRKREIRSNRNDKLLELRQATAGAWATYLSLKQQKKAHQAAVLYSQKTFDAYLKQFNVSKRRLLDLLNAEDDYFQSASQLVAVSVDEIIVAYRLLKLARAVGLPEHSTIGKSPGK
ncbi:MAG: TolC family outer membrane protein [Desulfobacteraceae bacterium]|nr:TolC family outer membrane protein [Desulfobacteraceae bacterium]